MATNIFLFTFVAILGNVVLALPCGNEDGAQYSKDHCIKMTAEREDEISKIVSKIAHFLDTLHKDHEDFDIRMVKLDIESHSEDEKEEKEVEIQVTVNDCDDPASPATELPVVSSNDSSRDREKLERQVFYKLNLPPNALEAVNAVKKNKQPLLVYVQEKQGRVEYVFMK